MGFRNPATSATAVATAGAGTARVRIYESIDGRGNPLGVISLEDGVPGDAPAQISAGSAGGIGGGQMTLGGGTYSGIAVPKLTLSVDQAGVASAQLTDAPGGLHINGQQLTIAQQRAWHFPRSAHTSNSSDTFPANASAFTSLIDRTITAAPAGDYLLTMTLVATGSVATPAFALLNVAGTDVLGSPRTDLLAGTALPYSFDYAFTWAGGDLRLIAQARCNSGIYTIVTAGSDVDVAYLGPRT